MDEKNTLKKISVDSRITKKNWVIILTFFSNGTKDKIFGLRKTVKFQQLFGHDVKDKRSCLKS